MVRKSQSASKNVHVKYYYIWHFVNFVFINTFINTINKGYKRILFFSFEPELIEILTKKSNESFLCLDLDETTKTLYDYWNPKSDSFTFLVNQSQISQTLIKRIMLSLIVQLFDPLGLLGPVILHGKNVMQSLWLLE